jgi:PAS domain S-box-containing protein
MSDKKPYVPPRLTEYDPKNVPELVKLLKEDRLSTHVSPAYVSPAYTIVVDQDRKYIEVSDSFSKLVGYKAEELLGMRYDSLTAPNSADISATFNLFSKLGYMYGLWMLVHRSGYRILIRYEAWLRQDANIQANIEVVQAIL